MRILRLLGVLGLVVGGTVGVASPAAAANGPWSVVSAGIGLHTCGINTAKSLYCWGRNSVGQLGDGTFTESPRTSPKRIGAPGVWASVSAGAFHTCAITTGKSLYCWGYNNSGQVGDGTTTSPRPLPRMIGRSGAWASVSTGGDHTCAISTGNSLYCWGLNDRGQVGDGTTVSRLSPKRIGTSGVWANVSAGGHHTCAVSTGKSLYCWGLNEFGAIGDGTTTNRPSPRMIGRSGAWATATAGEDHTCAVSTGKSLYCWGYNGHGQVGDGTTTWPRRSPTMIGRSGVWASATAGGRHTCAISTGSTLFCWGENELGAIGDGSTTERLIPRPIGRGAWARADAGGGHTCAISTGNSLYCWGYNNSGQVGDGTTINRLSPKNVP